VSKSIAIIGAGIAGLAAGCYGRMNGYDTQIFELHDKPGGLCTSWKRKGYIFDGCIHWLVGSRPGSNFNRIWQELGAVQGRKIVDHDEFVRYEDAEGKAFIVYTDVDRLERHMLELAPNDARLIKQTCNAIRRMVRSSKSWGDSGGTGPLKRLSGYLKMIPFFLSIARYGRISIQDYAARFSDPFLRGAFVTTFDMPDFPVVGMLLTLAWMHNKDAGYPIGGSLAFARAIERRYLDLGGEIHYKARVDKVLVEQGPEGDRAVGVRLADGTEHRADVVLSAADGHATHFHMLEGKYLDDTVRGYYDKLPIFPPLVQVSLGVDRDLSGEPAMFSFPLAEPITLAGETHRRLPVRHFCYDPTLAPEGKSVVIVTFPANYDYWKELYTADVAGTRADALGLDADETAPHRERYEAEKKDIAIKVIGVLDTRFPGIGDQVEVVDVATPMTYERYTGNWQGSMEGWLITTKTIKMSGGRGMDKTVPGLDNFYMAGQWVQPGGGVPTAAESGRKAIELICKRDRVPFTTQLP
jgi:phytoene dehydrogenase-like protein